MNVVSAIYTSKIKKFKNRLINKNTTANNQMIFLKYKNQKLK